MCWVFGKIWHMREQWMDTRLSHPWVRGYMWPCPFPCYCSIPHCANNDHTSHNLTSEAISSKPVFCRFFSSLINSCISGSASLRGFRPVHCLGMSMLVVMVAENQRLVGAVLSCVVVKLREGLTKDRGGARTYRHNNIWPTTKHYRYG